MKGKKTVFHNLPSPLSNFIGRKHEIAQVKQLLASRRLVTLTGPGGSGKTRLALEVANELLGEYEDGLWMTELASLSDETLVPQTIAAHLNVREQSGQSLIDTLANHLFSCHALLVIDNCEHLIRACAQFAQTVLERCPHVQILATSREMLGIAGETVVVVPSLSLPEEQPWKSPASAKNAVDVYARSEAVQLFVSRAVSIMQDFALNTENAAWVSEICRRLDGMPLAIELAAARVQALSVQQIAQRLDDRFHLLTAGSCIAEPRQQTLSATLDWSYALLSDVERKVLQRFSIFSGGSTLEAAEAVCAGEGIRYEEVFEILSHLVEKSLVVVDRPGDGETRYHLLETIRQYAREKLEESGEGDEVRNRHLDYFVQWARQVELHLTRAETLDWLDRFEAEHDNIRAALAWSQVAEDGAVAGLGLVAIAAIFWKLHGYHSEGRMWLQAALSQETAQGQILARGQALFQASVLAFYQNDYSMTRSMAEESLAIGRELGTTEGSWVAADALEMLAEVCTETGDYPTATRYYEESLALSRNSGYLKGVGENLKMLGWLTMRRHL